MDYLPALIQEFFYYLDEVTGIEGSAPNPHMGITLLECLGVFDLTHPPQRQQLLLALTKFIRSNGDKEIGRVANELCKKRYDKIIIGNWQSQKMTPVNLDYSPPRTPAARKKSLGPYAKPRYFPSNRGSTATATASLSPPPALDLDKRNSTKGNTGRGTRKPSTRHTGIIKWRRTTDGRLQRRT